LEVPVRYVSVGSRAYMMSTPPCRSSPGRGELKPLDTTGCRPFHSGTGHTHRPFSGPFATDGGALRSPDCEARHHQYAATAPPPRIHGIARAIAQLSDSLSSSRLARDTRNSPMRPAPISNGVPNPENNPFPISLPILPTP